MSYPTGGSGFGAPPSAPSPSTAKSLPERLTLGVAGLGVLNFLLGFAPFVAVGGVDTSFFKSTMTGPLAFLLAAGLLAGMSMLGNDHKGVVAAASIAGFLAVLFESFSLDGASLEWGGMLVLVLGFVQAAAAIAVVLFDAGVITAPAPKVRATPAPGFPAGFGQPPLQGFGPPQLPQSFGPPQYGPPQYGRQPQPQAAPATSPFGPPPAPQSYEQSDGLGRPGGFPPPDYGSRPGGENPYGG